MTALALAIEESGLRKGWIAEQLGVHPSVLSRWIGGGGHGARVDRVNREKLALLLRTPVAELFDEPDEKGYALARLATFEPEVPAA